MKQPCSCIGCKEREESLQRHLDHQFYKNADEYRDQVRIGQIIKGSEKYNEPFTPSSWSAMQLLEHAMQENVDQAHYIYGLYEHIKVLENKVNSIRELLDGDYDNAKVLDCIYEIVETGGKRD